MTWDSLADFELLGKWNKSTAWTVFTAQERRRLEELGALGPKPFSPPPVPHPEATAEKWWLVNEDGSMLGIAGPYTLKGACEFVMEQQVQDLESPGPLYKLLCEVPWPVAEKVLGD